MKKELWENTELAGKTFPMNVFHTRFGEHEGLQLHWHEHFEVILVERGEALFQVGGNAVRGSAGDIFFIGSEELHAIYSPSGGFTFYAVVFHPSMVGHPASDFQTMDMVSPYVAGQKRMRTRLRHDEARYPDIRRTLEELIGEFSAREVGYEQTVRALCLLLFARFARWFTESSSAEHQIAAFAQKTERFKELLLYLEDHLADKITLEKAASIVHQSPFHFCKTFKQLTGMTFVQFLNGQRVQEAERLLIHTPLTVSEIAERVGCGSINSFSKLYKQLKGCPPTRTRAEAGQRERPEVHPAANSKGKDVPQL